MRPGAHVPDDELLLAIDGELDEPRSAEVRAHLSHCWTCRVRRGELEGAITDFVKLRRTALDSPILTEPPWRRAARPLLLCAVAGLSVLGLAWLSGREASSGPLPDPRLTPGATRLISREQVCAVPVDDDARAIPAELAAQVFQRYGVENPQPRTFEVDYLITPALGGADDVRNLWPQPYAEGDWNSRVKDALEDHLRRLVCEGRLDLATAQHEIASDWIAAYRKYFRTRRPVAAHALFVKDRPWE